MRGSTIIFYLLAILILVCGFLAVSAKRIFRAAIFLLFSLVGIAGLYVWLQYEFIAAVQVVVYVGGIVVLIIFSIFLTQRSGEDLPGPKKSRIWISALAAFIGFALVAVQLVKRGFVETTDKRPGPEVGEIGKEMLDVNVQGYALPFEVVSMLLLAAMVGCIVIALRTRKQPDMQRLGDEGQQKEADNM